ncbi:MAG: hypothetical protein LBD51_10115 [Bifidobacteriaceae bacterium]|jgi:hypothetical protein|nr:hypothetical protein [Bifidobacteriaceae bacterium]
MTLLAALAILLVIRLALYATFRGNLEHRFFSTEFGALAYVETLEEMEEAGTKGADLSIAELFGHFRLRVELGYPAAIGLVTLVGAGIAAIPPAPTWLGAILPAAMVAFQTPIEQLFLQAMGVLPLQPDQTAPQKAISWGTRIAAGAVAWGAMWLGLAGPVLGPRLGAPAGLISRVIDAAAVLALLWVCYWMIRLGARLAQRRASPEFELYAGPETTLYLRSFADDDMSIYAPVTDSGLRSLLWPRISFEEFLSYLSALGRGQGSMVTIGRPGERLPKPGAVRGYFDETRWREAIRLTAERSGSIILTVGATDALAWEIAHLKEWGLLPKCTFLVPPLKAVQAASRVERLLDALEVAKDERDKAGELTTRCVVGLRVMPDGAITWLVAPGRDWVAYFAALTWGWVRTERTPSENPDPADEAVPAEPPPLPARTPRPTRNPPAVRRVVRRSWRLVLAYSRDQNDEAMDGYAALLAELQADPAADGAAVAHVMCMYLAAAADAERLDEALPAMEQLVSLIEPMEWVWVQPSEARRSQAVAFDLYELIADQHGARGDQAERLSALEKRIAAADAEQNRRHQAEARCDLAADVDDSDRSRELAEAALEHADHLGDPQLQGRAHGLLAHALLDLGETGWQHHGQRSADIFAKSGDSGGAAWALGWLAYQMLELGRLASVPQYLDRALELAPGGDAELQDRFARINAELSALRRAPQMLSPTAQQVWRDADRAGRLAGIMSSGHLLIGVLETGDEAALAVVEAMGKNPRTLLQRIQTRMWVYAKQDPLQGDLPLSGQVRTVVRQAVEAADARQSGVVEVKDLMDALVRIETADVYEALREG